MGLVWSCASSVKIAASCQWLYRTRWGNGKPFLPSACVWSDWMKKVTVAKYAYTCNGCLSLFWSRKDANNCAADCWDMDMFDDEYVWWD